MADQTIASVAATQTAPAQVAAKAPEDSTKPVEPAKTEAETIGTTAPSVGAGTKVNYYA